MDWLVTYKYNDVEHQMPLQARSIPNIQVVAFRTVMEVFGEQPPVEKQAGQPVLEWMRACGVDIVDVILLRRNSRGASVEGAEGDQGPGVDSA